MTQVSRFWNGTAVGDALTEAPYDAPTEFAKVMMAISGADADPNKGGVWYNDLSELAATNPSSTTVRIASGRAHVWGTWYENDANVDETPAAPAGSTRIDRYVLRKTWATQEVRITRIAGVEGSGAPALVQSVGTTWDYPIVQASTTTGGVVTLTDQRTFLGGFINPMTTAGDTIQGGAAGVPTRFAAGTAFQIPRVNAGATALEYVSGLTRIASASGAGASFDFQSIPATFKHLLVIWRGRSDGAGSIYSLLARFNNDSGANYDYQFLQGAAAVASAGEGLGATSILASLITGAGAGGANQFSGGLLLVPDYANGNREHELHSFGGAKTGVTSGLVFTNARSGFWRTVTAISRVTLLPSTGSFVADSCADIYGIGAS